MEGRVGLVAGGEGITLGRVHMEDVVRIRLDGVGIRLDRVGIRLNKVEIR